ncbi:MAG: ATP-dependent DNA helicase [Deltaproteobacteria bacterium]|nr:ATP-dependent DNA helicase [Deltaproteobacteria bacterium]
MTRTAELFESEGTIAGALESYELRREQVEMVDAVERCIEGGGENLQEQIFFKDLALLERALEIEVQAAYLKGQDNYLCLRRYEEFARSPAVLAHPPERVAELERWGRATRTGDRMEIDGLADDDPIWREMCSTRETRIGQKCRFFDQCHVTLARQAAQRAKIVVVNHHLYFADLVTRMRGGAILPAHDVVIFDEAHLIEDVATEFFSIKASSGRIDRLLRDVLSSVRAARLVDDPNEARRARMVDSTRSLAQSLFAAFRGPAGRSPLEPSEIDEQKIASYHRLDASLDAMEQSLRVLEGRDPGIDHCTERIAEQRDELAAILDAPRPGFVRWVETKPRTVMLGASPIDVSEVLREGVLFSVSSVVLTSATLATGGDFGFLRSRLGIDFETEELSLPAPFDFDRQACLYVPQDICDPRDQDFPRQAAATAAELTRITDGGTLVLCTSLRNMNAIHDLLAGKVPGPLLVQGSAPKTVLLARFCDDRSSVLVATTSFWQGVDLPGDALRLVVIDKLPFASPGDPIVAARIEHVTEQGQSAFSSYQVPQAALALKQGFGRLIRTRRDFGIVAILDRRLLTMAYARKFFDSLPSCTMFQSLADTEGWWLNRASDPRETAAPAG